MSNDPLLVVNAGKPCAVCGGRRRKRRNCTACNATGFERAHIDGLWRGCGGFLVCGGPSINKYDYRRLAERGIVSLAVNQIAGYVPVRAWTFGDPQEKFHWGNFTDPAMLTFAPIGKLRHNLRYKFPDGSFRTTDMRVCDCPNTWGFSRTSKFEPSLFLKESSAQWGKGKCDYVLDTMLLGLRLLIYMGCRDIYLFGVDYEMETGKPYAFDEAKTGRNRRYVKCNRMLGLLRPVFEAAGITVLNTNPESKCDAFDHISFDAAITRCKRMTPPEPFDLANWYSKRIAEQYRNHPEQMKFLEHYK